MKTLITKYLQSKEKTTAAPVLRMTYDVLAEFEKFCYAVQPKAPPNIINNELDIWKAKYYHASRVVDELSKLCATKEMMQTKTIIFTPTPDDGGLRDELDKLHRDGVNSNFTCSPCGIVLEIENILRRHPHPAQENKGPKK